MKLSNTWRIYVALKLVLRDEALKDIERAFYWYEEQSPGLGNRFADEVLVFLKFIETNPLGYQIKFKNYREAVLKVFPFVIIYEVGELEVVVYSVFQTSKSPTKKPW